MRTLLAIMLDKGHVAFGRRGRAKVYRALAGREEAQSSALRHLAQRLFDGSASLLLARLVEEDSITLEELDRLRRTLRQKGKRR